MSSRLALRVSSLLVVLPTSWRGAGRRFLDPGGRPGRACRVSARWRAGRPSRGCSGIPGARFDTDAQCCHEPPAISRAQLGSAEHSLITATPPPRRRFACATPGSRAATRSSAQTALYAACRRALQPGGVLTATSGRLARIADTPTPPCCLPPSTAPCPLRQSHADHPVTHARVCGKPARENNA